MHPFFTSSLSLYISLKYWVCFSKAEHCVSAACGQTARRKHESAADSCVLVVMTSPLIRGSSVFEQVHGCVCAHASARALSSLQDSIFPSCTAVITAHFLAATCRILTPVRATQRELRVSTEPHAELPSADLAVIQSSVMFCFCHI